MTSTRSVTRRPRMLVFRTGHLGDSLIALPVLRDARTRWPKAECALLFDDSAHGDRPSVREVLEPEFPFRAFVGYAIGHQAARWRMLPGVARAIVAVARLRCASVLYLAPIDRSRSQVARDRLLFRLLGANRFFGFESGPRVIARGHRSGIRLEADLLRLRISTSRTTPLAPGRGDARVHPTADERRTVARYLERELPVGTRCLLAVAPGTRMPSKRWPTERFEEVVSRLVAKYDAWPLVVGGADDRETGARMVASWKRGTVVAGALSPREASTLLGKCALFVGNDSGAMHLAAAAGTPCVAVFSMRKTGGAWHPYGEGHVVLEKDVPCRGCMLVECLEHENLCTRLVTVDEVERACVSVLERNSPPCAALQD